jgi:DNA-binding SARP family transcriptional activator
VEFRVLGPRRFTTNRRAIALGEPRRALLALLLVHAGEAVSTARLVDELWGENPPAVADSSGHQDICVGFDNFTVTAPTAWPPGKPFPGESG